MSESMQPPHVPPTKPSVVRRLVVFLVTLLLVTCGVTFLRPRQAGSPRGISIAGETMGTTYHVTLAKAVELSTDSLNRAIDDELERVNQQMSTYREDSEISRFNAEQGGEWFEVSEPFATLVTQAAEIHRASEGAFDATVGPLVNRWNFGAKRTQAAPPTDAELATLREVVGMQRIEVRRTPPALKKSRAGVQLDLSAIAKGSAVDRVARLLEAEGVTDYLVEIGGEVRVRGRNPAGESWSIGIEAPVEERRSLHRVIKLRDVALATSGDYRNFRKLDGRRLTHVIDPRSGAPIEHSLASVSVLAADCATADAWATALLVLGPIEGPRVAEQNKIAAYFLERTDGSLREQSTSAFDSHLSP